MFLAYGTANPEGYDSTTYDGVYLTDKDLAEMTPTMAGVDVKIEHMGKPVGKVISAWRNSERNGSMELVVEIDETLLQGAFASEFIKRKICKDFSLGYSMQLSAQPGGRVVSSHKKIVEVSIVRRGARDGCKIRGHS